MLRAHRTSHEHAETKIRKITWRTLLGYKLGIYSHLKVCNASTVCKCG